MTSQRGASGFTIAWDNIQDTIGDASFLDELPSRVVGDKAYDSDPLDHRLRKRGVELIAPRRSNRLKPPTQDGRPLRRYKRRWKVERLFAWLQNFRRLVVRYEYHLPNFLAMAKLGARIRLCAPLTLLPRQVVDIGGDETRACVRVYHKLPEALEGADVVMMLRIQNERLGDQASRFANTREYSRYFGLNDRSLALAKPDAIVMHPGPINRGVEMMPSVADGLRSVILDQVAYGVAVRMAALYLLGGGAFEPS